jgi:hypothetical protein
VEEKDAWSKSGNVVRQTGRRLRPAVSCCPAVVSYTSHCGAAQIVRRQYISYVERSAAFVCPRGARIVAVGVLVPACHYATSALSALLFL